MYEIPRKPDDQLTTKENWTTKALELFPPQPLKPLKVHPHPRQAEMDQYRSIPSWHP